MQREIELLGGGGGGGEGGEGGSDVIQHFALFRFLHFSATEFYTNNAHFFNSTA